MIPPVRDARLRAITRWLREREVAAADDAALLRRAGRIDTQMVEEFDRRMGDLQSAMMARPGWGTDEALAEFRTAEMAVWREVFDESLPVVE